VRSREGGAGERMERTYPVKVKQVEGGRFLYIEVGRREYFKPHRIVWIDPKLVTKGRDTDVVKFPARARVVTTEKGTIKLVADEDHVTFDVFIPCGYRGSSHIELLHPVDATVVDYVRYESERGSLGASKGLLVTVRNGEPVKVKYVRTGRLYGAPSTGIQVHTLSGVEDVPVDDLSDLENVKA